MASTASQAQRMGRFENPLGTDRLNLRRFVGSEYTNRLFEFRVEALDTEKNIDFNTLLGKSAHLEIDTVEDTKRYFHGVITDCEWTGGVEGLHGYAITLRPWLFLATMKRYQRIFHEMSVIEIIQEVLQPYSAFGGQVSDKTAHQTAKLHYTVQYRESDFAFVSRLMERHGINYHFDHAAGSHTLVLTDDNDQFPKIDGDSRDFVPLERQHVTSHERFWTWEKARRLTTGKVKLSDFNFLTPTAKMDGEATGNEAAVNDKISAYDWPGGNANSGEATTIAQLRVDQERALDFRQRAEGDVLSLGAGMMVELGGSHEGEVTGQEYLCLEANHVFENAGYASGSDRIGPSYTGTYTLFPEANPYRPPRVTPEARIDGPQTAMVVGKEGEEIDVDEHGRILVHLPWDLEWNCTMRVRCAQLWAHKQWGAMFIPRIGMEVVVVFIEGDPENPLVVGCVYNGANKPPWALPGEKNVAGIKSRSTKSGGADNYNEIAFDDTKGSELFRQQAEKDMDTLVKNDEYREVQRDRTTLIKRDEKRTVDRNETHLIKGNSDWTVNKNETRLVKQKRTAEVKQDETMTVGMNQTETVKMKRKTEVKMNDEFKVGMSRKGTVQMNDELKANMQIKRQANLKIELKCGASKITMTPASIKIESPQVEIKGTMTTKVKAGLMLTTEGLMATHKATTMMTVKGLMTTVKGSAMTTVKGGIVMIN